MGSKSSHHNEAEDIPKNRIVQIGPNFFNIRTSFKVFKGLVDIGTHMSLIRLANGTFIAIDTVPLDVGLRQEIDALTDNGRNIVAVIATHPFHTLAFPDFFAAYSTPEYIGTPRHIRNLKTIPWSQFDVMSDEVQKRWSPEIEMRIPAGAEFRNPLPEMTNHFNSVWVYHKESRTIHVDDTVMYFHNPSGLLKFAKKPDTMEFHISLPGPGLYPAPDAPALFKHWVQSVLADWDFDNMVCAHTGAKIGGAKEALRHTLEKAEPTFEKLVKKHSHNVPLGEQQTDVQTSDEVEPKDCSNYNVDGAECG
jgi:hypothetical protein